MRRHSVEAALLRFDESLNEVSGRVSLVAADLSVVSFFLEQ